jgi:hypothetical protein
MKVPVPAARPGGSIRKCVLTEDLMSSAHDKEAKELIVHCKPDVNDCCSEILTVLVLFLYDFK